MANIEVKFGTEDGSVVSVDNRYIRSLSSLSQSTPDNTTPQYGIIANSGIIEIDDYDGHIKSLIDNGTIQTSGTPVTISMNGKDVQHHISTDNNYNKNTKTFSLSLTNKLQDLDILKYNGYAYPDESRTLFTLLDDMLGPLGYPKERVVNWTKYQYKSAFTSIVEKTNTINVATAGGWESIGFPFSVEIGKEYTVKFKYTVGAYTPLSGYNGIAFQILNSIPTDSNCSTISISTTQLSSSAVTNQAVTVTFTPQTNIVYFVLNFGYAADSQDITFSLNDFSINNNNLSSITNSKIIYGPENVYGTIKNYLDEIVVEYPYVEQGSTYRKCIDNVLQIAQLQMFLDNSDNVKIVSGRPVVPEDINNPVIVERKHMFSDLEETIIPKNKYDGFETIEYIPNDIIKYSDDIYTEKNIDVTWAQNPDISLSTLKTGNDWGLGKDTFTENNTAGKMVVFVKRYGAYIMPPEFIISKKSVDGLSSIKELKKYLVSDNNASYSITYEKEKGECYTTFNYNNETFSRLVYNRGTGESIPYTITEGSGTFGGTLSNTASGGSKTVTVNVNLKDESTLTYREDAENYYVSCFVLYHCQNISLSYANYNSAYSDTALPVNGYFEKYNAKSISITILGDKREISFVESKNSSANINTSQNKISFASNQLMQTSTLFGYSKVSDVIKNNILNDYSDGIPTAKITLSSANYYNNGNTTVKDWSNGDILDTEDKLKLYNDYDKYGNERQWALTGRNTKYEGVPLHDCSLMQLKKEIYNLPTGLYNYNNELLYSWEELVSNGYITISDNRITNSDRNIVNNCKLSIPEGITRISGGFNSRSGITYIRFPNSLTTVDFGTFESCRGLTRLTIPESMETIGGVAFNNCYGLVEICNLSNLNIVVGSAENGFAALYAVAVINKISDSGDIFESKNIKYYTNRKTTPNIEKTAVGIGGTTQEHLCFDNDCVAVKTAAFVANSNITSLVINDNIRNIGYLAFGNCTNLKTVIIGMGISSIGSAAFSGCSSLESITINATVPPTLNGAATFQSTNNCPIYVPSTSVNAYKNAWTDYADRIYAKP